MNDPDGADADLAAIVQELVHNGAGTLGRESVKIEFGLNSDLAAFEFAHRRMLNAGPAKIEFVAGFDIRGRGFQAFAQRRRVVRLALPGHRPRTGLVELHAARAQRPGVGHRGPEQGEIVRLVVIVIRHRCMSRQRGIQYSVTRRLRLRFHSKHLMTNILLSNDDGFRAPGLAALRAALAGLGRVTVVAPDRNRSGASNSLTLDRPLRVRQESEGVFSVDGTPTDCVHLAITGLLDREPDMVVAGVNAGANLGDDVLYSGTVAAAMEGRFLGLPAMAVSLTGSGERHVDAAARVARDLLERLQRDPLPADTILNVNVPDCAFEALAGLEATRLGHRHRAEDAVRDTDPRGRPVYWIGPPGRGADIGPGTDFDAIERRCVSVTPLTVDLTRFAALEQVAGWLGGTQE